MITKLAQNIRSGLRKLGFAVDRIDTADGKVARLAVSWKNGSTGIRGTVIDAIVRDSKVWFFVEDSSDYIQAFYFLGRFYNAGLAVRPDNQ